MNDSDSNSNSAPATATRGEDMHDRTDHHPVTMQARRRDERGEGVISTAIAVLIVALLGVALWAGFSAIMSDATDRTSDEIESINGTP